MLQMNSRLFHDRHGHHEPMYFMKNLPLLKPIRASLWGALCLAFTAQALGAATASGKERSIDVVRNKALERIPSPVTLPVPSEAWVNRGKMTAELWVNPSALSPKQPILFLGKTALVLDKGIPALIDTTRKTLLRSPRPLELNTWSHIAVVADEQKSALYIDGVRAATAEGPAVKNACARSWKGIILSPAFRGKRDEIRFWSDALSGLDAPLTDMEDVKTPTDFVLEGPLSMGHPKYGSLAGCWKLDGNFRDSKWTEFAEKTKSPHTQPYQTVIPPGSKFGEVTDNGTFRYRLLSAYVRDGHIIWKWLDRAHLLNHSDIIHIGSAHARRDGDIYQGYPDNDAKSMRGVKLLPKDDSRENVLSFSGKGAFMNVGEGLLTTLERECMKTFTIEASMMFTSEKEQVTLFENNFASFTMNWTDKAASGSSPAFQGYAGRVQAGTTVWTAHFPEIKANEWFNIAFSRSSETNGAFYLNSKALKTETSTTQTPLTGTTNALICKGLTGKLDEMRIWHIPRQGKQMHRPVQAGWVDRLLVAHWGNSPVLGRDTASFMEQLRSLRETLKGIKGVRIRLDIAGGEWQTMLADAEARRNFARQVAALVDKYKLEGIDLDFEWPRGEQWNQYGELVKVIREASPSMIFTISPHKVSYQLPKDKIQYVDYFTFQTYGPSRVVNRYESMKEAHKLFKAHGYPDEKILLSAPFQGTPGNNNANIKQYRDMVKACPPDQINDPDRDTADYPGITPDLEYNGVTTILKKAKYVTHANVAGFMYWDIGEDIADASGKSNYFDEVEWKNEKVHRCLLRAANRYVGSTAYPETLPPFALQTLGADAPAAGGPVNVHVLSENNAAWTVKAAPAWITCTPRSGKGSGAVALTIAANTQSTRRMGTLVFSATDGQTCSFSVTQAAGAVSPAP